MEKEDKKKVLVLAFLLELELGRGSNTEDKNVKLFIEYYNKLKRLEDKTED